MRAGKHLSRENKLLLNELGSEHGHQRYKWCWSEDLMMPMRVPGEFDYRANPLTGIVEAKYRYEMRKTNPFLVNQWVLGRWQAPMLLKENNFTGKLETIYLDEDEFRSMYGAAIDYPRNGYYAPTNVELDADINPWDTNEAGESLTQFVVHSFKRQESMTFAEHVAEGERIVERREQASDHALDEKIGQLTELTEMSFLHTPGQRNGPVSYPSTQKQVIITGA